VVIARLAPSYAQAHQLDDEEAAQRLQTAFSSGTLLEELLASTWTALLGTTKRLDEAGLLEKIATCLGERPTRPGRLAKESPAFSAFLIVIDLQAGTASDAARRVLETPEGQKRVAAGMAEAGKFFAGELLRR
jgi:hypothetical protein